MEIMAEMQRISWLERHGQEPVLLLDIRFSTISVTGAEIQTELELFAKLLSQV